MYVIGINVYSTDLVWVIDKYNLFNLNALCAMNNHLESSIIDLYKISLRFP